MFKLRVLPVLALASLAVPVAPAMAASSSDRDHDALPDKWQKRYAIATSARAATSDSDHDGLSNRREYQLGTNPRKKDTDGDGYSDAAEVKAGSNPLLKSSKPKPTATPPVIPVPVVGVPLPPPDQAPTPDPMPTPTPDPTPGPPPTPGPTPAPAGPTASFSFSPASPQAGQSVSFAGDASTCAATPCSYVYKDADSGTLLGSAKSISYAFQTAGTRHIRLTVTDARSRAAAADRTVTVTAAPAPPPSNGSCDRTATTSTFASQFSAATAGQTICLATGDYGSWSGAAKSGRVTIAEQPGATASMSLAFNKASNLTIDGLTIAGGSLTGTTKNITITNSAFTSGTTIQDLTNANVVFDHDTFNNINADGQFQSPARIHLAYSGSAPSGVTVQNSVISGGDADGIQTGVGLMILNNEFRDIVQDGPNHSDAIQLLGATGTVIRGNYFHNTATGIVAYDGVDHATIEDNVLDLGNRPWAIELYSDNGSIIRHNTLKYGTDCVYNIPCGLIALDRKSADPAGHGTVLVDNAATEITFANGSTAGTRNHNLLRRNAASGDSIGAPIYTGGTSPSTYTGFHLAAGSPGKAAASDGADTGIS